MHKCQFKLNETKAPPSNDYTFKKILNFKSKNIEKKVILTLFCL